MRSMDGAHGRSAAPGMQAQERSRVMYDSACGVAALRPKQSPATGGALTTFSYFAGLVTFVAMLALVVVLVVAVAAVTVPNASFTAVRYGLFIGAGFIVYVA